MLHVGDRIVYNHRQFTAGSQKARKFATIVEFHKEKMKTNPMELSDGYETELEDLIKLHQRAGKKPVKEQDIATKQLRLFRYKYDEERWNGKTKQDLVDEISKKGQKEAADAIQEFIKTDGAKYADSNEDEEDDDVDSASQRA